MGKREREEPDVGRFLVHAADSPELHRRLRGADRYEVGEIAAAEDLQFGGFTLHGSICTGSVMRRLQ